MMLKPFYYKDCTVSNTHIFSGLFYVVIFFSLNENSI